MKYLIASDLHGSAYYCRKLWETFEKEQADRLLLLGDLLYHGPRNQLPKEYDTQAVPRLLNTHKEELFCVRGNCDAQVDQMVLDFPIMAEYALLSAGKTTIFATHGHVYHEKNLPPLKKGDILLCGHTHIPACRWTDEEILYLNPGSVSIPKQGSAHSYMVFDGHIFLWKDLENHEEFMRYELNP